MATLFKACNRLNLVSNFLKPRYEILVVPSCDKGSKRVGHPRKKFPPWLPKQQRVIHREYLTNENEEFVREKIRDKYPKSDDGLGMSISPLKNPPIEPQTWTPHSRRTGLIARKIGIYPMWLTNGKKVASTLLQVQDNHVVKYIPPEDFAGKEITNRRIQPKRVRGVVVVGAVGADPRQFTKEYCGLFSDSGIMPKKLLARFPVTQNGALQPGTPLYAAHFKPGHVVDIRAKTMDRGFQGVMKRWKFSGMPASHGVTKTHRRPGNIGSGGTKARVMPGQKLPGHMGNRYRIFRGVKILRVNTQYNVIWVLGQAIAGRTGDLVQIYDTLLTRKKLTEAPPFPTYFPTEEDQLPVDMVADNVHPFGAPSIEYKDEA